MGARSPKKQDRGPRFETPRRESASQPSHPLPSPALRPATLAPHSQHSPTPSSPGLLALTTRPAPPDRSLSAAFAKACVVNAVALDDFAAMSSSSQAPESWISAFCSLVGHEYFAEVSEDFIEDDFNLTGLQSQVPMYKEALEMILDVEPEEGSEGDEEEEEEEDDEEDEDDMQDAVGGNGNGLVGGGYRRSQDAAAAAAERRHLRMASDLSMIESSAEMLYGLIHQRFITSRPGIQQMAEKYELGHFGHCPRVFCHGAKVLPVGCSDIPGQETVKLFCPSCLDVYSPPNSRFQTVDGAFFGTTFGCLFFMTFPELDVGGQKAASTTTAEPSASTSSPLPLPNTAAAHIGTQSKDSRASLSSSLTSQQQQQQVPPLPSTSSTAVQTAQQPDSVNGVAIKNLAPGLGPGNIYEPRIYGFRVAEIAKSGPRMKWLRSRPGDLNDLDECRLWMQNQGLVAGVPEQPGAGEAGLGDSEMVDGNAEVGVEGGEVDEDEEMEEDEVGEEGDVNGGEPEEQQPLADKGVESAQLREVTQRKKSGRRRQHHDGLLNGDGGGGGTAVRVGDGG